MRGREVVARSSVGWHPWHPWGGGGVQQASRCRRGEPLRATRLHASLVSSTLDLWAYAQAKRLGFPHSQLSQAQHVPSACSLLGCRPELHSSTHIVQDLRLLVLGQVVDGLPRVDRVGDAEPKAKIVLPDQLALCARGRQRGVQHERSAWLHCRA